VQEDQQEETQATEQVENIDSNLESDTSLGMYCSMITLFFFLTILIVNSFKPLFFFTAILS